MAGRRNIFPRSKNTRSHARTRVRNTTCPLQTVLIISSSKWYSSPPPRIYQNSPSFLRRQRWAAPLPPLCVMQRTHCCVRAPPPSLFPYIRNLRREEKRKEFFPVSYIAGSGKRERRVSRILFFWEEALKSNFGLGSRGKQGDELMRILWGLERWKIKKGKKRKKSGQKYLLREEESFFLLWETAKSANCEKIAKSKPPL